MADVAIETSASVNQESVAQRGGIFWRSPTVGYVIYVDTNSDLVYRKTSDGGATWANAVAIVTGTIRSYDCWADWQTVGDAGTKIHIGCIDAGSNTVKYAYLDTSDDSVGTDTIEACQGTGAFTATPNRINFLITITKARGGNLAVAFRYKDNGSVIFYMFYTSPDGDTWTSKTSPWEAAGHYLLLFPGNEADNQDVWGVFWDISADEISLKTFDNSGNSWSEQSISGAGTMVDGAFLQMDGVIRQSDGHLLLAAWNAYDTATADLKTWDINGAASITAKTDILTDSAESFLVSLFINQNTDDVYATYARGTAILDLVAIFYKKSTDGMANWGSETAMQADAEDDERWVSCGAVKAAWGGKFLPVWFNDDLNDLFCNTTNGISIAAAVAGWTGSMWYGSQEVANPASIMGVPAANIQSVKGVVSS